jgi:hypothetical protein
VEGSVIALRGPLVNFLKSDDIVLGRFQVYLLKSDIIVLERFLVNILKSDAIALAE